VFFSLVGMPDQVVFGTEGIMDVNLIGNSTPAGPAPGDRVPAAELSSLSRNAGSTVQTAAAVEPPKAIPGVEQVTQAIKSINKAMESLSQSLEFSIDTDTHLSIVKVVDKQTNEVIRQMPTPEALEIAKALDQVRGLLIRQKA
jgi:flagellar protein FlaG